MRAAPILLALVLVSCGEPVRDDHFANRVEAPAPVAQAPTATAVPVRVGELGPNFDACSAVGTTRHLEAGARLAVRAAPFDVSAESDGIPADARFFVCSRSLDQKWLGIVYDPAGGLSERCGVSGPIAARRAYDGPCRSGWVASAFVRLISGIDQAPTPSAPTPAAPAAEKLQ